MGLAISHDAWHGAYSAFNRWRRKMAHVAGFPPLDLMEGFWNGDWIFEQEKKRTEGKSYNMVPLWESELPIKWEALRPDPLTALLNHSDCDGTISPDDVAKIADRLEQLLPFLPKEPDGGHVGDWRATTQEFIDGCRLAASAGESLEFC